MACNCKNTVTSFLGGDVANPTTFLNCGEADGTYNNPLETGKTQCIAENNVLRILDDYKISGTVKNAGEIIFERTFTGDTDSWEEWNNDGTYFRPINQTDTKLSAQTLNTSGNIVGGSQINATGKITTAQSIEVGTHDGSDVIYIERYSSASPYSQFFAGTADNNVAVGFRFVSRNTSGVLEESFTLLGDDKKATFQGTLVAPIITATTIAAKYSGATLSNSGGDLGVTMTTVNFRPNMLIEVDMAAANDVTITLPAQSGWESGKYTFIFPVAPHASSNFVLNCGDSGALYGMVYCLNGQERIDGDTTVTFSAGRSYAGTRIEVISTISDTVMINIWTPADKGHIAYS